MTGVDPMAFRLFIIFFLLCRSASAATIPAASASLTDVQSAVDSASSGDTVTIPNGNVTWNSHITGLSSKRIFIRALNYTPTFQPTTNNNQRNVVITYTGTSDHAIDMTLGNDFHCGVGGIQWNPPSYTDQSGPTDIWGYIHFSGSTTKPGLVWDCHFTANNRDGVTSSQASFLSIDCLGLVVWNCCFDGGRQDSGVSGKGVGGAGIHVSGPRAWATASTMGTLDTGGTNNIYFEDCRWYLWGQSDVDDNGRVVSRYSIMDGTGWQNHGFSSSFGGRHLEVYNSFLTNGVSGRNHSRYFWIRGGTGLFFNNAASDNNTGFGVPRILDLGDSDAEPPSGPYPVDRQAGFGHNGSAHVSDPVYLWDNTGGASDTVTVQSTWTSHVVEDRDYFLEAGAKPSYTSYTYPHPLRSQIDGGGGSTPVTPQMGLRGVRLRRN